MFTTVQTAAGGYGLLIAQTFAVLAFIALLGWVLTRFVAPRLGRPRGSSRRMRIVERMPLEGRKSLYLIEVDSRQLLVGVSEDGVRLVSDLPKRESAETPATEGDDGR